MAIHVPSFYLVGATFEGLTSFPDSKVNETNMGPILRRQEQDGPHVGPMNLGIWVSCLCNYLEYIQNIAVTMVMSEHNVYNVILWLTKANILTTLSFFSWHSSMNGMIMSYLKTSIILRQETCSNFFNIILFLNSGEKCNNCIHYFRNLHDFGSWVRKTLICWALIMLVMKCHHGICDEYLIQKLITRCIYKDMCGHFLEKQTIPGCSFMITGQPLVCDKFYHDGAVRSLGIPFSANRKPRLPWRHDWKAVRCRSTTHG